MKVLAVGVILASICFQTISALRCIQVGLGENAREGNSSLIIEEPKPIECTLGDALLTSAAMMALMPGSINIPYGSYECYHLTFEEKESGAVGTFKGCTFASLNFCDRKVVLDDVREVFCSQCSEDYCNSGRRFGSCSFTVIGLIMLLAFLLG